jgi:hypothetical protein
VNTVIGFHKRRGIVCLAERLSASQQGLCSIESLIRLVDVEMRNVIYYCKDSENNSAEIINSVMQLNNTVLDIFL